MKTRSILMIIIFIMSLAVSACGSLANAPKPDPTLPVIPAPKGIVSEGRVEPEHYVQLSLNTGGQVSEVSSREGDTVAAGQVIANIQNNQGKTLETAQADALQKLTTATQAERDAQYNLDKFDVPGELAGLTPLQAAKVTLDELSTARYAFEPYKNSSDLKLQHGNIMIDTGVYKHDAKKFKDQLDAAWIIYRKAVEWLDLESALENAKAQVVQAQKDVDDLQDPSLGEDTAAARAALASAEVRAPFAGTLTNLDLKTGEVAPAGVPVLTLADLTSWVVKTTDLTEIDVVNLSEGEPVDVTLDAMPGITLKGNVLSISKNYIEKQGDIDYIVTVLLTDQNPAIRWGMTARITFDQ